MRGQAEESPINLYSYVLRNKPIVEKFPNLCLLIEFMFDISVSNASVERIIAIMKIIKNSQRLCLGQLKLNNLMNIKFNTPPPGMLESDVTARVVEHFLLTKQRRQRESRLGPRVLNKGKQVHISPKAQVQVVLPNKVPKTRIRTLGTVSRQASHFVLKRNYRSRSWG